MNRRLWLQNMTQGLTAPFLARASTVSLAAGSVLALSACAGPQISDYAAQTPVLDLRTYWMKPLPIQTAHNNAGSGA